MKQEIAGNYYLVVEGAIPTKDEGIYCTVGERDGHHITVLDRVKELGEKADAVIAIGTCAAYGGIAAAKPNPTDVRVWILFLKMQGFQRRL